MLGVRGCVMDLEGFFFSCKILIFAHNPTLSTQTTIGVHRIKRCLHVAEAHFDSKRSDSFSMQFVLIFLPTFS